MNINLHISPKNELSTLITAENGLIEVVCSQRLILRFQVEGLDIEVSDTGFRGKGHIKTLLFLIERSSTAVYE